MLSWGEALGLPCFASVANVSQQSRVDSDLVEERLYRKGPSAKVVYVQNQGMDAKRHVEKG